MPGAVNLGALCDLMRAAVVTVEQAVEDIHRRRAHDVTVLNNSTDAWRIVHDIEAGIAEVAWRALPQRGGNREEVAVAANDRIGPMLFKPTANDGLRRGTVHNQCWDWRGDSVTSGLLECMGGLPLVGHTLGEAAFDHHADAGVATLTQAFPSEPHVRVVVGHDVMEMGIAGWALDRDNGKILPI